MQDDQRQSLLEPWKVLGEDVVYDGGPWFRVLRQRVELPDGRVVDDYHRVWMPEYVTVLARTPDGQFVLVRKYSHGYQCVTLSAPGGAIDQGETALDAARRELIEETGFAAERWTGAGSYVLHSNYGCGRTHFLFASGAERVRTQDSGDLEEIVPELVSAEALRGLIRDRKIVSLSTIAAVAMLLAGLVET